MKRLTHKEYDRLNQAVLRLYDPVTPDHFPRHLFEVLEGVMPTELVGISMHDLKSGAGDAYMNLPIHGFVLNLLNHMDEFHKMPGVRSGEYFSSETAFSMHDFTTLDAFKNCVLYEFVYKPADLLHDLMINLNQGPSFQFQINLARGRKPFAETERFKLALLRPHLMARVRQMSRDYHDHPIFGGASPISEHDWMHCSRNGAVVQRSSGADDVLAQVGKIVGDHLPKEWLVWLEKCICVPDREKSLPIISHHRGNVKLIVHCLPNSRSGEHRLILKLSFAGKPALTRRETEILQWIKAHKTNAEIAIILSISPGTVKVHVEHILAKLGVANRHAAAAFQI